MNPAIKSVSDATSSQSADPAPDADPELNALYQQSLKMRFLMFTYGGGRERLKRQLRDARLIEIPTLLEDRISACDRMA